MISGSDTWVFFVHLKYSARQGIFVDVSRLTGLFPSAPSLPTDSTQNENISPLSGRKVLVFNCY